jgi:hypothetical protein
MFDKRIAKAPLIKSKSCNGAAPLLMGAWVSMNSVVISNGLPAF